MAARYNWIDLHLNGMLCTHIECVEMIWRLTRQTICHTNSLHSIERWHVAHRLASSTLTIQFRNECTHTHGYTPAHRDMQMNHYNCSDPFELVRQAISCYCVRSMPFHKTADMNLNSNARSIDPLIERWMNGCHYWAVVRSSDFESGIWIFPFFVGTAPTPWLHCWSAKR